MKFLTDEWFNKVEELHAEAGDLEIPDQLASVVININVNNNGETREFHLDGGNFARGHSDKAEVTLGVSEDLARKIFVEGDNAAGMQAFMAGEIKIDGDMTKLMALQTVQPSAKQKQLLEKIKAITE